MVCFQTKVNAGVDLVKRFFHKENSWEVIQIENQNEKGLDKYVKKIAKYKAEENISGQQRIYQKIIVKYPKSSIAKEAAYARGNYLYNEGNWEGAFQAFSNLKLHHPDFEQLDSVIELQFDCAVSLMDQPNKKIFGLGNSSLYNAYAVPLFIEFSELYPYDSKTPEALLYAAKVLKSEDEFDSAIRYLKKIIINYPESPQAAETYFIIAHIYSNLIKGPEYDLESTREAIRYCEDFFALFPEHKDVDVIQALYESLLNVLASNRVILADYYYFNRLNNLAAIIFYNEAISIAPKSQAAVEAKERLEAIKLGVRPTNGQNFIKKLFFIN